MQVPLLTGFYTARSVIASAQRCLNLYPEINSAETYAGLPQLTASAQVTVYPTPGTRTLASLADDQRGPGRGLYAASNGNLYAVVGNCVYYITPQWQYVILGYIQLGENPVSMQDNAVTLVLVDGTSSGYTIDLATNIFTTLIDGTGSFVGADRVDYLDGFLLFNKPNTPQFYSSLDNVVQFDPLYFANKNGAPDTLVTLIVNQRNIWLIGADTTEIWYDAGNADFPFAINPSNFIQHGCAAKYSVAKQDNNIFWLGRDPQGHLTAYVGTDYTAAPITTFAIQNEWSTYPRTDDAVGFCYQQLGHVFYVLTFPTADKTWVFDATSTLWHERAVVDSSGQEHRIRANGFAFAYGKSVVIDYANGALLEMDPNLFTDLGEPIVRERSFPHVVNEMKRLVYRKFIADMETGDPNGNTNYLNVNDPVIISAPSPSIDFINPPTTATNGVVTNFIGNVVPNAEPVELAWSGTTLAPSSGWIDGVTSGNDWAGSPGAPNLLIAFTSPTATGTWGQTISFSGTVEAIGTEGIEIAFGTHSTISPVTGWVTGNVAGTIWSGTVVAPTGF